MFPKTLFLAIFIASATILKEYFESKKDD